MLSDNDDFMDEIPIENNCNSKLNLPGLNIEFKDEEIYDFILGGKNGWFPLAILDSIADKICIAIARNVIDIQIKLCSKDDICEGKALRPSAMFTDEGKLKDEYSKEKTDKQKRELERVFSEIVKYKDMLNTLKVERKKVFPNVNRGLQYAFLPNSTVRLMDLSTNRIYSAKDAINCRLKMNPRYLRLKEEYNKNKQG